MSEFKTPGVYVQEISKFPPPVAEVETAIPAFIGYTDHVKDGATNPQRITSLLEYESYFGAGPVLSVTDKKEIKNNNFLLYDSIRLFYDNGGGVCYIKSIGTYAKGKLDKGAFNSAFGDMEKVDEVTLVLFPDAVGLEVNDLADVQTHALQHCKKMGDRFAILDLKKGDTLISELESFRNTVSSNAEELRFGAAYHPYVSTGYTKSFSFADVFTYTDNFADARKAMLPEHVKLLDEIVTVKKLNNAKDGENKLGNNKGQLSADAIELRVNSLIPNIPGYTKVLNELNAKATFLPPSGAIAGIIASTDNNKGVWAAPANVSIASVRGLSRVITDDEQEGMNVDAISGKSVNAIRPFTGKGILVWGARTLDGNSNEWRYVSVRRLFNFIEESVKKATAWAVFSPNDTNTWVKIKSQIETFLNNLWRRGALAGARPDSAFFVKVGLNETMNANDILEGRLIVEIGLAAVRPAEFIILRFSHKVQE